MRALACKPQSLGKEFCSTHEVSCNLSLCNEIQLSFLLGSSSCMSWAKSAVIAEYTTRAPYSYRGWAPRTPKSETWKASKLTTFWRHSSRFWSIWDFTFSDQGCWNGQDYTNIPKARTIQNMNKYHTSAWIPVYNTTLQSYLYTSACLAFLPTQWIVLCLCQQNTKHRVHTYAKQMNKRFIQTYHAKLLSQILTSPF